MRILVTAGPTREYIDTVRFITNASSGRMGAAVADAAAIVGHEVTLLTGPIAPPTPESQQSANVEIVRFVTVEDLRTAVDERFAACDALVMAAAVGDFRVAEAFSAKLPRAGGPVTLRLIPTEDILAGLGRQKRPDQTIVAFAVEDGPAEQAQAKAREEMARKNADYVVVNTPAAMAADESMACVLSRQGVVLPWANRPKRRLAAEIIKLLADTS